MTAVDIQGVGERYDTRRSIEYLEKGSVVLFACGTGQPLFSTDTAAVLRAAEIHADAILLAKNIDGIYDSDPAKNPDAKRFDTISIDEVIERGLQAVDMTASILAKENHMPMRVFALQEENSIVKAASGAFNGTTVTA
jgi:uridylate kinase